ncbi:GFA family protein [Marinobacter sp. TBZ242]|uniref:GFA family protein n=1 Tax=Marinobacter azerbaijanicus TaxID=3050455 RepID=A0ABT7I9Q0_9GAMM|nr:GFA family protein [Marinobacter sp. TBZ242]MDL0429948.1 GFA family protein [Marinobacter sp. TBZ242]
MNNEQIARGSCFCGTVEIEVRGVPEAMGYCHCESCRHWSAGPVNAFTLWKPEAASVIQGEDKLGTYRKTSQSYRKWCRICGGHVLTDHPSLGLVDVYAAIIPDVKFSPGVHVHYQERVLPVRDGIVKFRDVPAEMGGSGETMPD